MNNKAVEWLKEQVGDMSLREFGDLVGLHHVTVGKALDGDATTDTWIKLAEHFGEPILKILWWANKTKRPPTSEELSVEFHGAVYNILIDSFPPAERDNVIRRLKLEAQLYEEQQRKAQSSTAHTRRA